MKEAAIILGVMSCALGVGAALAAASHQDSKAIISALFAIYFLIAAIHLKQQAEK